MAYVDVNQNSRLDPNDWIGYLDSNNDGNIDKLNTSSSHTGLVVTLNLYGTYGNATVSGKVTRFDGGSVEGALVALVGPEDGGYETENNYMK